MTLAPVAQQAYWPAIKGLCQQAQEFHARGWMLGTSGNLSIKVNKSPRHVAITSSGRDKSTLAPRDILLVDAQGHCLPRRHARAVPLRPSAETAIHLALYELFPECQAVFHVHTLYSTALTSRCGKAPRRVQFLVDRLEMLKGFELWEQDASAPLPVFPNWPSVQRIADDMRDYYRAMPAALPVLLIAHHGLTAWGHSAAAALKHVEIAEFICRYLWTLGAEPVQPGNK